jgi:hypothetical protein
LKFSDYLSNQFFYERLYISIQMNKQDLIIKQLEDQGIDLTSEEELEQEYVQLLLSGPLKHLWEE